MDAEEVRETEIAEVHCSSLGNIDNPHYWHSRFFQEKKDSRTFKTEIPKPSEEYKDFVPIAQYKKLQKSFFESQVRDVCTLFIVKLNDWSVMGFF